MSKDLANKTGKGDAVKAAPATPRSVVGTHSTSPGLSGAAPAATASTKPVTAERTP